MATEDRQSQAGISRTERPQRRGLFSRVGRKGLSRGSSVDRDRYQEKSGGARKNRIKTRIAEPPPPPALLLQDRLASDWRLHSPTTKGRFRRLGASMTSRSWPLLSPIRLADATFAQDLRLETSAPALEVRTIAGVEIAYNRSDLEQLRRQGAEILRFAGAKSSDYLVVVSADAANGDASPANRSLDPARSATDATTCNSASEPATNAPAAEVADATEPANTIDTPHADLFNNSPCASLDIRIREQFIGGAHELGLTVGDASRCAYATIMVGPARSVLSALAAAQPAALHTVVVTGDFSAEARSLLTDLLGAEGVIHAWAPDAVQSFWANCRGGDALHLTGADLVEVVDPVSQIARPDGVSGRLLWSGVGWLGSSLVRIDTGAHGGIVRGACPSCGRHGDRVYRAEPTEVSCFPGVIDRTEEVADWYGEVRHGARANELHLWLALENTHSTLNIEAQLRSQLGEVTLYESTSEEVRRRRDEARGESWLDVRARELRGAT